MTFRLICSFAAACILKHFPPPQYQCPAAAELFKKASDILGYDLLSRCTEGPKELLDSTEVSQPAIFVASMAAVEKVRTGES